MIKTRLGMSACAEVRAVGVMPTAEQMPRDGAYQGKKKPYAKANRVNHERIHNLPPNLLTVTVRRITRGSKENTFINPYDFCKQAARK